MSIDGNVKGTSVDRMAGRLTIISRRVSRFTLKGIFLITMAVGMISSSCCCRGLAPEG